MELQLETMTNLKWNFTGTASSNSNVVTRLVKSSAFGAGVGSNYSSGDWWNSLTLGTTYNANTAATATWNTGTSAQSWVLSANATTAAQSDGFLKFAAMNALWDFGGAAPAIDVYQLSHINNSISGGYTRAKITFDWEPAATGWQGYVNGVISGDIDEINKVDRSDIDEINSVESA